MPFASDSHSHPVPTDQPPLRPLLLAPAGNWDCLKAAIENGADAVYFGLNRFNARMRAENFTEADLPAVMAALHKRGVKGYVTLNTLVFPAELAEAERYLRTMITAGVDAVIVQDVGICRLIRQLSPDFPIHASTQMTITSAAGVEFAQTLGCQLVVLARECSLQEIRKIQTQLAARGTGLPLEVFVHGALCVAYSGQCLTSEALGGRSANRGECAQACRMPYELWANGQPVDLGNRAYLLSPQDLVGLEVIPELIAAGLTCFKIEGRLKSPEYVANVTRIYRQAIDRVMPTSRDSQPQPDPHHTFPAIAEEPSNTVNSDRYALEMAFSRGLYTGWFRGIDNQALVHAQFGKKRGVYVGTVTRIQAQTITIQLQAPIKAGDGIVFDHGHPEMREEGGRVYTVQLRGETAVLTFGQDAVNFRRVHVGDKVWKTSDPELDKALRQTYAGDLPKWQRPLSLAVYGSVGEPLVAIARDDQGHIAQAESTITLVTAQRHPLDSDRLRDQFGRLGNTPFYLDQLTNQIEGAVMLPMSELNRLRRHLVEQLDQQRAAPHPWKLNPSESLQSLLPVKSEPTLQQPSLIVLARNLEQLQAAQSTGITCLYCELENPSQYREAVQQVRHQADTYGSQAEIWVAPPRITKPSEQYILEQVMRSQADGYLVRNYDHLNYFAGERCIGDFSLNVANPLTADYFKTHFALERLTASYDLNNQQLADLLRTTPPDWLEITIHQHMPMFHMEHCVFCAFLSAGKDFRDCGRPCETQAVTLRDRVGTEHLLKADAGCRNTVFNGVAQTGAEYAQSLLTLGARYFRLEFLHETPAQVIQTIERYQQLLQGEIHGTQIWRDLKLQSRLGVTRGSLDA